MPPFGSPDGQGPVLVPLLLRVVIEMPPFGSPDGQGSVLVPLLIRVVIEMLPFRSPDGQGLVPAQIVAFRFRFLLAGRQNPPLAAS